MSIWSNRISATRSAKIVEMESVETIARSINAETLGVRQGVDLSVALEAGHGKLVLQWEGPWRVGLELGGNYKGARSSYSGRVGAELSADGSFERMEEGARITTGGGSRASDAIQAEIVADLEPLIEEAVNAHKDYAGLYFVINFNESVRIHRLRADGFRTQKAADAEREERRVSNLKFEEDGVARERDAYAEWLKSPAKNREEWLAFERIWGQSGRVAKGQRVAREKVMQEAKGTKAQEVPSGEIEI